MRRISNNSRCINKNGWKALSALRIVILMSINRFLIFSLPSRHFCTCSLKKRTRLKIMYTSKMNTMNIGRATSRARTENRRERTISFRSNDSTFSVVMFIWVTLEKTGTTKTPINTAAPVLKIVRRTFFQYRLVRITSDSILSRWRFLK